MADAQELIDFIGTVLPSEQFTPAETGQFAVIGKDQTVESLEAFQIAPNRARANRQFYDTDALAAYVQRFGSPATVAVADWKTGRIAALIDYHEPGGASHVEHTATFKAELSATYGAWRAVDREWRPQKALGEFLEERCRDVVQPMPADVMQMVMDFEVERKAEFKQVTRLDNGTRQAVFIENDQTKGMVQFRDELVIQTPVYMGMPAQNILVRVRYRIQDGKLSFMLRIDQREILEQDAFEKCIQAFRSGVSEGLPLYRGAI